MRVFYGFFYYLFRFFFKIFHRHQIYGLENFPKGAALLAANHASFYDPPLVGTSCPEEICYLARKTLFNNPIFGWVIGSLNSYPVNQENPDHTFFRTILKLTKEGEKVLIFPEGERTPHGKPLPFKGGVGLLAYRCQVPVVPIYVHGTFEVWPIHKSMPCFWGKTACVFGKPIDPKKYQGWNKKEAQQAISDEVEKELLQLRLQYESGEF